MTVYLFSIINQKTLKGGKKTRYSVKNIYSWVFNSIIINQKTRLAKWYGIIANSYLYYLDETGRNQHTRQNYVYIVENLPVNTFIL